MTFVTFLLFTKHIHHTTAVERIKLGGTMKTSQCTAIIIWNSSKSVLSLVYNELFLLDAFCRVLAVNTY